MEKIKLFVDFDSTLVNSREVAVELFNEMFKKEFTPSELKRRNFTDLFPSVTTKVIHEVFSSDEFYKRLLFKEESYKLLTIYSEFYNIQLVTKINRKGIAKKAEWISRNISSKVIPNIIFVDTQTSKRDIDMSEGILVDDFIDNIRETNAKIKVLYAPYPKAEECQIDNLDEVYVVSTWHEIGSILEFYKGQGKII